MNCITKETMVKILDGIKSLDGDVLGLVNLSPEKRLMFWEKYLGDSAKTINNKFERALISKNKRALGDFFKSNFDEKTIIANLDKSQKTAIKKYILEKLLPVSEKSILKTGKEVSMMPEKERLDFLRKYFDKDQINEIESQLKSAEIVRKQQVEVATLKKAETKAQSLLNREKEKIDNYIKSKLGEKEPSETKKGITANDVAEMVEKERISYLKSIGVDDAEMVNERMMKAKVADIIAKGEQALRINEMRKVKSQERIITDFIKKNLYSEGAGSTFRKKINKPIDEILLMPEKEQLDFLSRFVDNPREVMIKLKYATKGIYTKQIESDLNRITDIQAMRAFIDKKIPDMVAVKGKSHVSVEQVEQISKISRDIEDLRMKAIDSGKFDDRVEWGLKQGEMRDYVETLLPKATKTEHALSVLGAMRIFLTTGEFSPIMIQGYAHVSRFLIPGGGAWKSLKGALLDAYSIEHNKRSIADFITRDSYKDMVTSKLMFTMNKKKLSAKEDGWMSNLFANMEKSDNPILKTIGKLEFFGRFQASYLTRLRVDAFEKRYANLKNAKADFGKPELEELGRVINDFTGASSPGKYVEKGNTLPIANQVLFSLRKTISDIRKVTVRPVKDFYRYFKGTKAEKIIATEGLVRFGSMVGTYIAISSLIRMAKMAGEDVEIIDDPKSSKFGDARIGDKTINISGGSDWVVTLAARLLAGGQTDQLGILKPYGTGYGQSSMGSTIIQTGRYKLSPNAALVADFFAGENAVGEKFFNGADRDDIKNAISGDKAAMAIIKDGAKKEAFNRMVPMYYQSIIENPNLLQIPGIIGMSQNQVYYGLNFAESDAKKIKQFREFVGVEKTDEAEKKYNKSVYDKVQARLKQKDFIDKTPEEQSKEADKIKEDEKNKIFREYRFVYNKNKK